MYTDKHTPTYMSGGGRITATGHLQVMITQKEVIRSSSQCAQVIITHVHLRLDSSVYNTCCPYQVFLALTETQLV
jgi:hypothetical protein